MHSRKSKSKDFKSIVPNNSKDLVAGFIRSQTKRDADLSLLLHALLSGKREEKAKAKTPDVRLIDEEEESEEGEEGEKSETEESSDVSEESESGESSDMSEEEEEEVDQDTQIDLEEEERKEEKGKDRQTPDRRLMYKKMRREDGGRNTQPAKRRSTRRTK